MDLTRPIHFKYTNCAWTAPAITELNFATDCQIVGEWGRTWLSGEMGVNDFAAANFFGKALPPELREGLTSGQLIDWYHTLLNVYKEYKKNNPYNGTNLSPWKSRVINGPINACEDEVCGRVEWSGVPDILGPGVMTSAFIQAILASILAILPLWEHRLKTKGITPSRSAKIVIEASNAILNPFIDAGTLLNIWINIAVIIVVGRRNELGDGAQVALAHDIAVFSMYATILPAVVDEMVHKETKRRNARIGLIIISGVLYIITGNMAGALSNKFDHMSEWELFCFWDIIPRERKVSLPVIMAFGLGIHLWFLLFGIGPTIVGWCWPAGGERLRRYRRLLRLYFAIGSCFLMWYMLITVTVVRQLLLAKSGYNSEDLSMSFGQVLALGTWLPVLLELWYILRKGVNESLNDRVPQGWVVVREEQAALIPKAVVANSPRENLAPAESGREDQELLIVNSAPLSSRTSQRSTQSLDEADGGGTNGLRSTTI